MNDDTHSLATGSYFPFRFAVSRAAWDAMRLHEAAPPETQSPEAEVRAMRMLAHRLNDEQRRLNPGTPPVTAGQLLSLLVLQDVLRYLFEHYSRRQMPGSLGEALEAARDARGKEVVDKTVPVFVGLFPPRSVLAGQDDEPRFLKKATPDGVPHRHLAVQEAALLRLLVENPAAARLQPLFDDAELQRRAPYLELVSAIEEYYENLPPVDRINLSLFTALRAPMKAAPDSLEGQLGFIRRHWGGYIPPRWLQRLEMARSVLQEETMPRGLGPGPAQVLDFRALRPEDLGVAYPEPEQYTLDRDWMAELVLMAKIVYVWLDQLSRKYGRHLTRLDEIPDAELDLLAERGLTGLWLIGVWERSFASAEIKRRMGNPEAAPSAYSLYDYVIAAELGGDEAFQRLRDRAWQRGIRLASDMVPNHVGIVSKWMLEHPDWFIQRNDSPFPAYRFTGPDLCQTNGISACIEDGYWTRSDAAVVFKRVDSSGEARYLYHGNDGTSMPWNDTAQLNYLLPEVREAVIQTIVHVARMFPVIRFDAAMTLAKRHFQRLWFPRPGEGGAIPSRAEHGMTQEQFDAAMPQEFWREVVDRLSVEAPDTLLLAEAFWLMEGYFVRTLGMHRVYNSAFMNMLKKEENLNYRTTIKNVLEFSPGILERFVNFMNNPDELTAAEQFGDGDKYFGVSAMMATLPGLPMFGHGQIEGLREKYGMEYRKAYWDEQPSEDLIRRHEREIFPLARKRYLFSGVEHFALYDFITPDEYVDENVFAYSNRAGNERALFVFNNAYGRTRGHIHTSTAINVGPADQPRLTHRTLAQALGLHSDPDIFYMYREHREGLEYLRSGSEISASGLYFELDGYAYRLLMDFREVHDHDGRWRRLAGKLGGKGVPSIEAMFREELLAPVVRAFEEIVAPERLRALARGALTPLEAELQWDALERALRAFLTVLGALAPRSATPLVLLDDILDRLDIIQNFDECVHASGVSPETVAFLLDPIPADRQSRVTHWAIMLLWAIVRPIGRVLVAEDANLRRSDWLDRWLLRPALARTFAAMNDEPGEAEDDADLVALLASNISPPDAALEEESAFAQLNEMLDEPFVRRYVRVNTHNGVTYFHKEQFERMLYWLTMARFVAAAVSPGLGPEEWRASVEAQRAAADDAIAAAATAEYRMDDLRTALTEHETVSGARPS